MSAPGEKAYRSPGKPEDRRRKRKDRLTGPEKEALVLDRVNRFAEPLCESEGMELVHVEYLREQGGRVLRIYIDRPEGVTVDDCARISRQVGDWLDVSLEEIGPYSLEVSSPGPERPIGRASDFERFRGRKAKISISPPREGRKNFTGFLLGVKAGRISLQTVDGMVEIPMEEIRKARLADGE
ncbi:MAG: ribosome maturation factor RimP [Desulfobacterales bacterium]